MVVGAAAAAAAAAGKPGHFHYSRQEVVEEVCCSFLATCFLSYR